MKQDYTDECLDIINNVIKFGFYIKKYSIDELYEENPQFINGLKFSYDKIYRAYPGPPKDIYQILFDADTFESIQFDWAIWWAKEKGIISHHGPAGTKGWCLYTDKTVKKEDVVVGDVSPFCPSSMLPYMQSILKYSGMIQQHAQEEYETFDAKVAGIRAELESERDAARFHRKLNWS